MSYEGRNESKVRRRLPRLISFSLDDNAANAGASSAAFARDRACDASEAERQVPRLAYILRPFGSRPGRLRYYHYASSHVECRHQHTIGSSLHRVVHPTLSLGMVDLYALRALF